MSEFDLSRHEPFDMEDTAQCPDTLRMIWREASFGDFTVHIEEGNCWDSHGLKIEEDNLSYQLLDVRRAIAYKKKWTPSE